MPISSPAFVQEKLCIELYDNPNIAALKHACPKGIYVAPDPEHLLQWIGVLSVRKGPYANAVLRFRIVFPTDFPLQAPAVTFFSDVFHPLVNPLTTYTYSTRSPGGETISAADQERLPPGGLSLRHMYPEWFHGSAERSPPRNGPLADPASHDLTTDTESVAGNPESADPSQEPPHVVEILQYLRVIFDTEAVLDSVPLEAAANSGAWHAWNSYRSRTLGTRATSPPPPRISHEPRDASSERAGTARQQPGGAKRPGEWDWQGVWEERVKRCIQASISEPVLFGGDGSDLINFHRMEPEILSQLIPGKVQ